jgi:hypothetical protein
MKTEDAGYAFEVRAFLGKAVDMTLGDKDGYYYPIVVQPHGL